MVVFLSTIHLPQLLVELIKTPPPFISIPTMSMHSMQILMEMYGLEPFLEACTALTLISERPLFMRRIRPIATHFPTIKYMRYIRIVAAYSGWVLNRA